MSDCKWDAQSLQIRRFSVESGLQTTTLFSFPLSGRKSGEFQPAEHVTACHRFVTALFGAEKCAMEKRVCVVAREFELRDIFPQSINLETPRVCKTWLILPVVLCLSQSRS